MLVLRIFVFTLIKKEDNGPNSQKITLPVLSVELLIPHFLKEKGKNEKTLACLSSIDLLYINFFFESVVDFSKAFLF